MHYALWARSIVTLEKSKLINDLFWSVVDECSKNENGRGTVFYPACMHAFKSSVSRREREGQVGTEQYCSSPAVVQSKAKKKRKKEKKKRARPFTPLNCATCLPLESRSSSAISGAPAGGCGFPYPIR